jgi:hypothetical protein
MLDKPIGEAQAIIEKVVRETFPPGTIHAVEVLPDPGEDGENYLQVTIEVDEGFAKKHAKEAIGLVRHMRPKLFEVNETRFPVMQFVSREDAEWLRREAG